MKYVVYGAVLAAIGYYGISEYQKQQDMRSYITATNERIACRAILKRNWGASPRECLEKGYVTIDEIKKLNGIQ
ncbi:hypothetical protein P106B_23 [Rhizobium phage vB_RglS_P106B]|uniref:Uncharacterized protein n=1 Tax=Rhizobium phage vB_RglS_P106B TaxID=1458697 RepID=W6EKF1_9CAUD|nr:hypothetical protein P106B_23 [Rhizobium phage vB_RglS_P106B]AHJ10706.1 hypothetical protein P106B_23 [Rhizobium phage vB_RglS_P106B]